MNKKLKIILFSLSLVGLLNNGRIFSAVEMAKYEDMCDGICTLAKEHPTITTATVLIAIALMTPTIYKGAKKTTETVCKHPKKAVLLTIPPIVLYCLGKYCQEQKFVRWFTEKYTAFLASSPCIKITDGLGWTDDQFLKFVNWLSPQIQKPRKVDEPGEELYEEEEEELEIKEDQGVNSIPEETPLFDNREHSIIVTDNNIPEPSAAVNPTTLPPQTEPSPTVSSTTLPPLPELPKTA